MALGPAIRMSIFVGESLKDPTVPPAMVLLDPVSLQALHECEATIWQAMLAICHAHIAAQEES